MLDRSKYNWGGVPTAPDVARLMESIPIEPGTQVTHKAVMDVIGITNGANRFKTITSAWRKHIFRTMSLDSTNTNGVFEFLKAKEALVKNRHTYTLNTRGIKRMKVKSVAIDSSALDPLSLKLALQLTRQLTEEIRMRNQAIRSLNEIYRPNAKTDPKS